MKKEKEKLTVYIPISFPNIDMLVTGTKLKPDKIRILLHQMYLSRLGQAGYDDNTRVHRYNHIFNDGYVSLRSKLLNRLLARDYKNYISFLKECKLISVRESYSSKEAYTPTETSKHYKINNKLLHKTDSKRHFRKETVTNYCTVKATLAVRDSYELIHKDKGLREIPMEPIHQHLLKMEQTIRFDIPTAEEWIKQVLEGVIVTDNITPDDLEHSGMELELANSINEGILFNSKVDQFGERLYTPLKRVAKYMRQFMYFENSLETELACLDISNSQLYFSTLLVNKDIIETIIPEFLPITKIAEKYGNQPDFKRYIEACINGTIYDEWIRIANHTDRNAAKKELIQILFCKNNAKMPSIKIFRDHFPSVAKFFREVKDLKEDTLPFITKTYLDKKGSFKPDSYHCNLSCATQRLESRIFIKHIGQALLDNGVKPFFTIHDSVYFPKYLTEKVEQIITDEFHLLGVAYPKLKPSNP
jgi:hypothetical protein